MPKRSRIDVHALLIRSARPAAEKSGEGAVLVTLWLGAGLGRVFVEWLDCRIGSEDPVSREAAVAAAATLREKIWFARRVHSKAGGRLTSIMYLKHRCC